MESLWLVQSKLLLQPFHFCKITKHIYCFINENNFFKLFLLKYISDPVPSYFNFSKGVENHAFTKGAITEPGCFGAYTVGLDLELQPLEQAISWMKWIFCRGAFTLKSIQQGVFDTQTFGIFGYLQI